MKIAVWIIECNHAPFIRDGHVVSFPCSDKGTREMKAYLNIFPVSSQDSENYYDAVLYRRQA